MSAFGWGLNLWPVLHGGNLALGYASLADVYSELCRWVMRLPLCRLQECPDANSGRGTTYQQHNRKQDGND